MTISVSCFDALNINFYVSWPFISKYIDIMNIYYIFILQTSLDLVQAERNWSEMRKGEEGVCVKHILFLAVVSKVLLSQSLPEFFFTCLSKFRKFFYLFKKFFHNFHFRIQFLSSASSKWVSTKTIMFTVHWSTRREMFAVLNYLRVIFKPFWFIDIIKWQPLNISTCTYTM